MNLHSSGLRLAGVLMLGASVAMLGGCSGDDSSGGGGGGTKYGPPPTARPSLNGLNVLIDVSGGNASAGGGSGGGNIEIDAQLGAFLQGNGPGRQGIDANIISAASLADNVITPTELQTDAGIFGVATGTDVFIELVDHDFYVPASATLDLSSLTAGATDRVTIRTHGRGNYIRIDGDVVLSRAGANSVQLVIESVGAEGLAISIDGDINSTSPSGFNAGNLDVTSHLGHIAITGLISLNGGSGTTAGNPGDVLINARQGNLYMPRGIFQSNGGNGSTNGSGGGEFEVYLQDNNTWRKFNWGIRANGGTGGTGGGGSGGDVYFYANCELDMFSYIELHGGNSTSSNGGDGGYMQIETDDLRGVVMTVGNGGDGTTGGSAVDTYIEVNNMYSLAIVSQGTGGAGSAGTGGFGGDREAYAYGNIIQVLIDEEGLGGNGTSGGGDGVDLYYDLAYYGLADRVTIDGTAHGGNATTSGSGGDGGSDFYVYFEGPASNTDIRYAANGGSGISNGGSLGYWQVDYYADCVNADIAITMNSGSASTGSGGSSYYGYLYFEGDARGVYADITLNGGNGSTNGSSGGYFYVDGYQDLTNCEFNFNSVGGNGGTGSGGDSGYAYFYAGSDSYGGIFTNVTVNLALMGGNSTSSDGGDAQGITLEQNEYGHGRVRVNGYANGGNGVDGGSGGYVDQYAFEATLEVTYNLVMNGGNGTTGDGGDGGEINFDDDDEHLIIRGTLTMNGGNSTSGSGGDGGEFSDVLGGYRGGLEMLNFNLTMLGGNSDSGQGGAGGYMDFSSGIEGRLRVADSSFNFSGGNGSVVSGTSDGGDGSSTYWQTASADIYIVNTTFVANGGTGRGTGGDGGFLTINADSNLDTDGSNIWVDIDVTVNGGNGVGNGTGGTGGGCDAFPRYWGTMSGIGEGEFRGTWIANGGNGAGTGNGGDGGGLGIYGGVLELLTFVNMTANGGTGVTGGMGGGLQVQNEVDGSIRLNGNLTANGGVGTATGGMGGGINIGATNATVVLSGSINVRANGGSGPANGAAGTIDIEALGAGGVNVTFNAAQLQTNTGAGTAVPANITIS